MWPIPRRHQRDLRAARHPTGKRWHLERLGGPLVPPPPRRAGPMLHHGPPEHLAVHLQDHRLASPATTTPRRRDHVLDLIEREYALLPVQLRRCSGRAPVPDAACTTVSLDGRCLGIC